MQIDVSKIVNKATNICIVESDETIIFILPLNWANPFLVGYSNLTLDEDKKGISHCVILNKVISKEFLLEQ